MGKLVATADDLYTRVGMGGLPQAGCPSQHGLEGIGRDRRRVLLKTTGRQVPRFENLNNLRVVFEESEGHPILAFINSKVGKIRLQALGIPPDC